MLFLFSVLEQIEYCSTVTVQIGRIFDVIRETPNKNKYWELANIFYIRKRYWWIPHTAYVPEGWTPNHASCITLAGLVLKGTRLLDCAAHTNRKLRSESYLNYLFHVVFWRTLHVFTFPEGPSATEIIKTVEL